MELREGVLHIWDVQGPKKEGNEKARLEAVEQEIFKCQGMVERGLSANHSMITKFYSWIASETLARIRGGYPFKLQ